MSRILLVISILAMIVSNPAFSQELEEVVVTAQRRSENLQDVPIVITAFSAGELQNSGINSYDDLGLVTPGLSSNRQIGAATPYLRGVGAQSTQVGVESATSIYLDDVYISGVVDSVMSFNNIDHIEILKGPQGTLFGRNTTGGVIHVVTKDPSHEPSARLGVHIGNYEVYGGNFYGTTGVSEELAIDLSVATQKQDDRYGVNRFTGQGVGYDEYTRVRSKLIWTPSERTVVKLSARWSDREDDVGMIRQCSPTATFGCIAGSTMVGDFNDNNSNVVDQSTTSETWAVSAKWEQEFKLFDFVSISSYKKNTNLQNLDQDATPVQVIDAPLNQTIKTFSQEFQLLSNDEFTADWIDWIAGLYYWDDKSSYDPLRLTGLGIPNMLQNIDIFSNVETQSIAVFGQITFHLSDRTRLTGGLRWTVDDREINGHTDFGPLSIPALLVREYSRDESWDDPTWRLALDFKISEDMLLFATYNRGVSKAVYLAR